MYVDDQTPSFFQSAFLVLTFLLLVATLPVLGFYYSLWGFVPPPSEGLAAPGSAAALLIAYLAVGLPLVRDDIEQLWAETRT